MTINRNTITFRRTTPLDWLALVREQRQGCHELAYKIATGEDPESTQGWQRDTTLRDYEDLDVIGRAAVRLMPAGYGAVFAGIILNGSWVFTAIQHEPAWVQLFGWYLVVSWVVLVTYDPFWGVVELMKGIQERVVG